MGRNSGALDLLGPWVRGTHFRARWLVTGVLALSFAAWTLAFDRSPTPVRTETTGKATEKPKAVKPLSSECPLGTLPDSGVCIPAPAAAPPQAEAVPGAPTTAVDANDAAVKSDSPRSQELAVEKAPAPPSDEVNQPDQDP